MENKPLVDTDAQIKMLKWYQEHIVKDQQVDVPIPSMELIITIIGALPNTASQAQIGLNQSRHCAKGC